MSGTRGFTVIEALVAFAIVAVALAVLIRGVGLTARGEARAETILAAKALAEDRLARLGSGTPITIGESRGTVDDISWTQTIAYWTEAEAQASGLRAYRVVLAVHDRPSNRVLISLETVKLAAAPASP